MDEVRASWSHGEFAVTPAAGMLTDLVFDLDGTSFRPLARAPWLDDPQGPPGCPSRTHLDVLGGEFPCVPFGADHGHGANAIWSLELDDGQVSARIDYPAGSAVRSLERRIRPVPGAPEIRFELIVDARADARLPIGVHPVLRLPAAPGGLSIHVTFDRGYTHPSSPSRSTVTSHGTRFNDLAAVPAPGGTVDLSRLPLASDEKASQPRSGVDDGGMLCGARSPVTVHYLEENAELVLAWDDDILPSINYWYSDGGISDPPWNGRYRGLGLEPANAYFDYGVERSVVPNSLTADGLTTSVGLAAGTRLTVAYSLGARSRTTVHERTADAH